MGAPTDINPRIIESLYGEGLLLSDDVRAAFDFSATERGDPEDLSRIALSCEALRTTTRMMHAVAWLLNHRAFMRGEISEFQLMRYGKLQADFPRSDPERIKLIDDETRVLIQTTERFYARLVRLDRGWRSRDPAAPQAIERLRERLGGMLR